MPPGSVIETGRAISGIGEGISQRFMHATLGTELLYAFVLIVISLMIFLGTRELYKLSGHKGIKYFRLSFLFFAIAFFFRSFVKSLVLFFNNREILHFSQRGLGPISLFLLMYASSIAIFYLLLSVNWKKWKGRAKEVFFHILAVIISIISVLINNVLFIFIIYIVLFLFILAVLLISYTQSKKRKKKSHLHGIYVLLFIFWILNILDILIPNYVQGFQLLIYFASIGIFLGILYKVLRRIGK